MTYNSKTLKSYDIQFILLEYSLSYDPISVCDLFSSKAVYFLISTLYNKSNEVLLTNTLLNYKQHLDDFPQLIMNLWHYL